jgi:hypothetical protein
LHNLTPKPVHLIETRSHFSLDGQCDFQIQRTNGCQQQVAERAIKVTPGNAQALLFSILAGSLATDVIRIQVPES